MKERYITILRHKKYTAYQVRLPVPIEHREYPYWYRSFKYTSEDSKQALLSAKYWRDERGNEIWGDYWMIMLLDDPMYVSRGRSLNNRSGVVGVAKHNLARGKYWIAQWQIGDGPARKTKRRMFSVAKWGDAEAKAKAIEAREAGVLNDFERRNR